MEAVLRTGRERGRKVEFGVRHVLLGTTDGSQQTAASDGSWDDLRRVNVTPAGYGGKEQPKLRYMQLELELSNVTTS